jgi:type IV pilus assembly protein PilV
MSPLRRASGQSGFGMVEVLVTLFILLVGLLGLAGVLVQSQRSELESYQRAQALLLAQDMAARINLNRNVGQCYGFTPPATGGAWLGTGSNVALPVACATSINGQLPPNQTQQLLRDLQDWNNLLLGSAEAANGNAVGAMSNARGCVSYDPATALPELDAQTSLPTGNIKQGSGIFTVTVAWQGMSDILSPPGLNCAQNQYQLNGQAGDGRRRAISYQFRIATMQ